LTTEEDKGNVQNKIDAYELALALEKGKIDNASNMTWKDIHEKGTSLQALGYTIPELLRVYISRRYSQQMHFEGKKDTWAVSVTLLKAGADAEQWTVDDPFWKYLSAFGMDKDSEEFTAATQKWPSAVFTDRNIRNMTEAGSKELVQDLVLFDAHLPQSTDTVPADFRPVFNAVRSAARGLVGMANPEPLAGSAELADVQFIMPRNGTVAAVYTLLPRLGRVIVGKIRKDAWWLKMQDDYMSFCGTSRIHGPPMKELSNKCEISCTSLKQSFTPELVEEVEKYVNEYASKITTWRKETRPGGTVSVDNAILAICTEATEKLMFPNQRGTPYFARAMDAMGCAVCKIEAGKALSLKIRGALSFAQTERQGARFDTLLAQCAHTRLAPRRSLALLSSCKQTRRGLHRRSVSRWRHS